MKDSELINISTTITMLFISLADELDKSDVLPSEKLASKIEAISALPAAQNPQAQAIYASVVRALRLTPEERVSFLLH